jgi:hypothetical protein
MSPSVQRLDSTLERVLRLLQEEVDGLLQCPAEGKEAATHEALARLRPHMEAALEALEDVGRLRDLNDVELVREQAFVRLLDIAKQADYEPPTSETGRRGA